MEMEMDLEDEVGVSFTPAAMDDDDADLFEDSIEKFKPKPVASPAVPLSDEKVGTSAGKSSLESIDTDEPTASQQESMEGSAGSVGAADEEDDATAAEPYIYPEVKKPSELWWTEYQGVWRPCRLIAKAELTTLAQSEVELLKPGMVYVELFPFRGNIGGNNIIQANETKLRPYNYKNDGVGNEREWSVEMKEVVGLVAKAGASDKKKKKRRTASFGGPKKPTISKKALEEAMGFAEETLRRCLLANDERRAAIEAEAAETMEEAVAQDDEEQEDHHAEDQGDAAEDEEGTSWSRRQGNVVLRPGEFIAYKRPGVARLQYSHVFAVRHMGQRNLTRLVQVEDQTWLSADDIVMKIKRAKSGGVLEDIPEHERREMKLKDHHLVPHALKGFDMSKAQTKQQSVSQIMEEAEALNQEAYERIFMGRKKRGASSRDMGAEGKEEGPKEAEGGGKRAVDAEKQEEGGEKLEEGGEKQAKDDERQQEEEDGEVPSQEKQANGESEVPSAPAAKDAAKGKSSRPAKKPRGRSAEAAKDEADVAKVAPSGERRRGRPKATPPKEEQEEEAAKEASPRKAQQKGQAKAAPSKEAQKPGGRKRRQQPVEAEEQQEEGEDTEKTTRRSSRRRSSDA